MCFSGSHLGKDYFLIPTLITCLGALLLLRPNIESTEAAMPTETIKSKEAAQNE